MSEQAKAKPEGRSRQVRQQLLRRAIIGSLCSLLLLAALFVGAVHLSGVQRALLQRLISHVEASAGVTIHYRAYHWRPFSMLRLDGLKVHSAAQQLLHCRTAQLRYRLAWKWPFVVPILLTLQEPVLYLRKDRQGHWIFPKTQSRKTGKGRGVATRWRRFHWPDVKIVSGEILGFQQSRQILALHNLNGTLSLQLISEDGGASLKIRLGQWQQLMGAP